MGTPQRVLSPLRTLAMALALPAEGCIVACDMNEEWTGIGREYWRRAGVADKIDLRIAPASETLTLFERDGGTSPFDLAFINTEKTGYDTTKARCGWSARGSSWTTCWHDSRVSFMPCHDVDFVTFHHAVQADRLFFATTPSRSWVVIAWTSLSCTSNSAAICWFDRFRPIRYKHTTQTFKD